MFATESRGSERGERFSYYLQGVRRVFARNYAVLRYCYYRESLHSREYKALIAGWNFRPYHFIVFKAEYMLRERKNLNTFLASVSGMF